MPKIQKPRDLDRTTARTPTIFRDETEHEQENGIDEQIEAEQEELANFRNVAPATDNLYRHQSLDQEGEQESRRWEHHGEHMENDVEVASDRGAGIPSECESPAAHSKTDLNDQQSVQWSHQDNGQEHTEPQQQNLETIAGGENQLGEVDGDDADANEVDAKVAAGEDADKEIVAPPVDHTDVGDSHADPRSTKTSLPGEEAMDPQHGFSDLGIGGIINEKP
ncbi:MAG: hypothetical protein SGARI_001680, partial [Bacillariaceae sp.]